MPNCPTVEYPAAFCLSMDSRCAKLITFVALLAGKILPNQASIGTHIGLTAYSAASTCN